MLTIKEKEPSLMVVPPNYRNTVKIKGIWVKCLRFLSRMHSEINNWVKQDAFILSINQALNKSSYNSMKCSLTDIFGAYPWSPALSLLYLWPLAEIN